MCDLEICRICLRTGCKMYRYDRFKLKHYYEDVLATEVTLPDDLPSCFCYECAALLYKFHQFKIKCNNGQSTMKARFKNSGEITYEAVKKIDRKRINLTYLEVLKASKRVHTFIETDSTCIESDVECSDESESTENSDTEKVDMKSVKLEDKSDVEITFYDEYSDESKPSDTSDTGNNDTSDVGNNDNSDLDINYDIEEHTTSDIIKNLSDNNSIYIKEQFNEIKEVSNKEIDTSVAFNENEAVKLLDVKDNKEYEAKKIKRDADFDENGVKKSKYARQRTQVIDESLWKCYFLSEEDVWKEFRALAEEPKYVAAEHKCGKCHTWFRTRDKLKRHNFLKHESRGRVECQFCASRFARPCDVQRHLRNHYRRFECLKCGLKTCSETSALVHQEMHSGARRCCVYCGETFRHSSTYYTHLRTHRSNFICTLCGLSFVSELGLEQHKKITHYTLDGDEESSDDYDTSVNTYCARCSIRFESRKAYIEHVFQSAAHDEADENELEPVLDPARKKILSKTHKEEITSKMKGMTKEDWARRSNQGGQNKAVKRRGYRKKPTECHQCGQSFETQAACIKHHRKEHPYTTFYVNAERHICEICGANLAKGSIRMHQNMHSREVMHTCEVCGKSFHAQITLRRHYLTHTGEKPYPCTACDKRFTQSNSMKLHYRTVHLKQPYPKRNRRPKEPKDTDTAMDTAACSDGEDPGISGANSDGKTCFMTLS